MVYISWSRGVAVNMPACHAGDRRFDPGRDRHYFKFTTDSRDLFRSRFFVVSKIK